MDLCVILILLIVLLKLFSIVYNKRRSNKKHVRFLPGVTEKRHQLFQKLIKDINRLIDWCVKNDYPTHRKSKLLQYNWNRVILNETNFTDHVAYVIDKNKKFYLCVSTPDGENEDENTMRYVVFHELGHMMSVSFGQNDEFVKNFLAILRVGTHLGIYVPVNYTKNPVSYCGLEITSSLCDSNNCNKMRSE